MGTSPPFDPSTPGPPKKLSGLVLLQIEVSSRMDEPDFVLTDPPYIAKYVSRDGQKITNDDRADWLQPAFKQVFRVLKKDAFCISFYGWHQVDKFMQAWRIAGFRPVGHLVFQKSYSSKEVFLSYRHEQAYLLAKEIGRASCRER